MKLRVLAGALALGLGASALAPVAARADDRSRSYRSYRSDSYHSRSYHSGGSYHSGSYHSYRPYRYSGYAYRPAYRGYRYYGAPTIPPTPTAAITDPTRRTAMVRAWSRIRRTTMAATVPWWA